MIMRVMMMMVMMMMEIMMMIEVVSMIINYHDINDDDNKGRHPPKKWYFWGIFPKGGAPPP